MPDDLDKDNGAHKEGQRDPSSEDERRITSPQLDFLLRYRLRAVGFYDSKSPDYVTDETSKMVSLNRDRLRLLVFCQRHKLDNIRTGHDLHSKAAEIAAAVSEKELEDQYLEISTWRQYRNSSAHVGQAANEYILVQRALQTDALGILGKSISQLTKEDTSAIGQSQFDDDAKARMIETSLYRLSEIRDDDQVLDFYPRKGEVADYEREAEELARPMDDIKIQFIYSKLEELLGIDIVRKEPAIRSAKTLDEILRLARPLPEHLSVWAENGLPRFFIGPFLETYHGGDFIEEPDNVAEIARIILPDVTNDAALQAFRASSDRLSAMMEQSGDSYYSDTVQQSPEYLDVSQKLLQLKRKFYSEVQQTFSEATEPLHPDIEKKALLTAAHCITDGKGYVKGAEGISKNTGEYVNRVTVVDLTDATVPLADHLSQLRTAAYVEGVYLDPLLQEMRRRLIDTGLNPREIAMRIQEEIKFRNMTDSKFEQPFEGNTDELSWFVREALFTGYSTLDESGNYDEIEREATIQRYTNDRENIAVTDEIIHFLENVYS